MQTIELNALLGRGARGWGSGPQAIAGYGWPGPDADSPVCASCGGGLGEDLLDDGPGFCPSCEERSHLGEFPEIYVELGGGD